MAFEPSQRAAAEDDAGEALPLPLDEDGQAAALSEHHTDTKLRTTLTKQGLQSKLLSIYRDAREIEEEQGVKRAFPRARIPAVVRERVLRDQALCPAGAAACGLAAGQQSRAVQARPPRPGHGKRTSRCGQCWGQTSNSTLPDLPDGGDWLPSEYHRLVQEAVSLKSRWQVLPNVIELRFFSFAKFLMWNDLSPEEGLVDGRQSAHRPFCW